jgi:hypothetical protein
MDQGPVTEFDDYKNWAREFAILNKAKAIELVKKRAKNLQKAFNAIVKKVSNKQKYQGLYFNPKSRQEEHLLFKSSNSFM